MNFYEMFTQGLKPAIYRNTLDKKFAEKLPFLVENFPYLSGKEIALLPDPEVFTYIFFQDEDMKESFSKKLEGVEPGSKEFHRILGHTLGYPPKAVEYFADSWRNKEKERFKVGMYYLGIGCSGNVHDLVTNCLWLWEKYQIPDKTTIRLETKLFDVEFMDTERLEQLKEKYLQQLVQIA